MMNTKKCRLAMIQMNCTNNKEENLKRACMWVKKAAQNKADIVCLPECFTGVWDTTEFKNQAESMPGNATNMMAACAKECNVYLVAGTMIECEGGKYYNTCTMYDPKGNMIGKHRKMHMCDMTVPWCSFKESDVITPGNCITMCDTVHGKVGLCIGYEMRFPQMCQLYANKGCDMIICPAMFDCMTGPTQWTTIQCCRALDCQVFMVCCGRARNMNMTTKCCSWAHSSCANPWGEIMGMCGTTEDCMFCDMDMTMLDQVRMQIPVRKQRRTDCYQMMEKNC